jgi:hypothetical protein
LKQPGRAFTGETREATVRFLILDARGLVIIRRAERHGVEVSTLRAALYNLQIGEARRQPTFTAQLIWL